MKVSSDSIAAFKKGLDFNVFNRCTHIDPHNESLVQIIWLKDIFNILHMYLKKKIDIEDLVLWVNTIYFSNYYTYEEKDIERISNIINELEKLDEISYLAQKKLIISIVQDLLMKQ